MQYKGKELKEANGADYPLGMTPKKMLVWTGNSIKPIERDVLGFYRGLWLTPSTMGVSQYAYAAEIPTEEETLLTNRELAKWLAQGNGEASKDALRAINTYLGYLKENENELVDENLRIRKWDDDTWRKPTKEYCFGEV